MSNVRFKVAGDVLGLPDFRRAGDTEALSAKTVLARQLVRAGEVLDGGGTIDGLGDFAERAEGKSVVVWLNEPQAAGLMRVAEQAAMSKEATAAALVRQAFSAQLEDQRRRLQSQADMQTAEMSTLSRVLVRSGKRMAGEHQQAFFEELDRLASGPADHKVLFAEAGTGVGKTFAMLVAAAKFAIENDGAMVVLAFPTYAVLEQAHESWRALRTEDLGADRPADRVVLAQAAFVSETATREWLEALDDAELKGLVQEWIRQGAPAPIGGRSEADWQMLGLHEACGGRFPEAFEAEINVAMRLDDDDAGYRSYVRQKGAQGIGQQAQPERVLFMTHAMLGTMILGSRAAVRRALDGDERAAMEATVTKWRGVATDERGVLREQLNDQLAGLFEAITEDEAPLVYADYLIVDEGHLFEEWVSRIVGADISVWSLVQDVKALRRAYPRFVSAAAVDGLEREFELLKQIGTDGELESGLHGGALAGLWGALEVVGERGQVKGGLAKSREWRRVSAVKRIAEVLRTQRVGAASTMARLVWSPDRMWPRVQVGRTSVARELDWLWSRMSARSVLVSATLYESVPTLNVETARRALGVRAPSVVTMSPLHPRWIFEPVTVMRAKLLHRSDQTLRFVRPKLSQPPTAPELIDRRRWAQEIGEYVAGSWSSAAGGMLVLLTSYTDLNLAAETVTARQPQAPVIVQRPGRQLAHVRKEFIESRRTGARPVLLLVGAGWTGFDVTVPGDPNAVTDLVMPLLPFGSSRGITQAARELREGVLSVTYSATMMARQGLGRLVRAEGTLHNRRIHFLDARWESPRTRGMYMPIMKWITSRYERVLDI